VSEVKPLKCLKLKAIHKISFSTKSYLFSDQSKIFHV